MMNIHIRLLTKEDYGQDIFKVLGQLSPVDENIQLEEFSNWFDSLPKNHFVFVVVFEETIVGLGTLWIENKIIHSFGKVGHIEDIVVDKTFRGRGIGKLLLTHLVKIAREQYKVYKVILNSSTSNIGFYEHCGFTPKEQQMVQYFMENKN